MNNNNSNESESSIDTSRFFEVKKVKFHRGSITMKPSLKSPTFDYRPSTLMIKNEPKNYLTIDPSSPLPKSQQIRQ